MIHGLIYPLTVASKSLSQPRQSAALRVLAEIRKASDTLVEQVCVAIPLMSASYALPSH